MMFRSKVTTIIASVIIINTILVLNRRHLCNADEVSDSSPFDICEFINGQKVFCNCDDHGLNNARMVTCFITDNNPLSRTDPVWNEFRSQRNITSFVFTTRFESRLSFVPISALRNMEHSLDTLNLNEMNIVTLEPYAISNFTKLTKISLGSNNITELSESSIAHLPSLKSLSLASNSLQALKANVFVDLPNLQELILDRNKITLIEDNAFIQLKELREIDLRLNSIRSLTAATFAGLGNLKSLDLSRNKIKKIPDLAFAGTPLLRELDLSFNEIAVVEELAFRNNGHLMSLQLSENDIKYLPKTLFKSSPQLALIDLSANSLETIEYQLIKSLHHLNSEQFVMYLKENLLECDCRLVWMYFVSRTAVHLFKTELKETKCTVKKKFAHLVLGEKLKATHLGQNESFVELCNLQNEFPPTHVRQNVPNIVKPINRQQTEESVRHRHNKSNDSKDADNTDHGIRTDALDYETVAIHQKSINESRVPDVANGNKVDNVKIPEYMASKTGSENDSTESINHKISYTDNSIVADAVPNAVIDSKANSNNYNEQSDAKSDNKVGDGGGGSSSDGKGGGALSLKHSSSLVMSCLVAIVFIFCKKFQI